jgi:predicted glycosyltransferase
MNILIDVGHPAHVHLFTPAAKELQSKGHRILFTIRSRVLIPELLTANGFEYRVVSTPRSGKMGQFLELLEHDGNVFKAARVFKPDFMLGTSVTITHVAHCIGSKSIVFNEDDADYIPSFVYLAYPFADTIATPAVLRDKKTKKYLTYEGCHELAYLHPDRFTPDPSVLNELGVKKGEDFFILRLVAFKAHHDKGHQGLSFDSQLKLVKSLSNFGKVFITNEGSIPEELQPYQITIPPHRIHHALYYAKMLVSDGQTMTIEAAVLGTPAIRLNTFVGMCSVIEELEHKYGLTYGFTPDQEEVMFSKIETLLSQKDLKKEWARLRGEMLKDKIDLTGWMINLVENYRIITSTRLSR